MTNELFCQTCGKELQFQERNLFTVNTKDDFVRITMYCIHCSLERHFQMPVHEETEWTRYVSLR